ncbi:MAG TPA: hypothetical protein VKN76_11190 [Kiloniellaceae bacterium]|nr:hypothetical protein [Kiloniellaceae bacterium]
MLDEGDAIRAGQREDQDLGPAVGNAPDHGGELLHAPGREFDALHLAAQGLDDTVGRLKHPLRPDVIGTEHVIGLAGLLVHVRQQFRQFLVGHGVEAEDVAVAGAALVVGGIE